MNSRGSKDSFTVVPWVNAEQFNKVYRHLYSDSLSKKRWAVEQISVWKTRCHPSLPTAIEATSLLVRASIQDTFYQSGISFNQEEEIRVIYSLALSRFVSATLEHHQNAANKIPMSVLAAKHNLPVWLVDLRHEVIHGDDLPSLELLRLAVDFALRYLEESFWSVEGKNNKCKTNLPSNREAEIVNVLNKYKNLQFQRFESKALTRSQSKDLKSVLKKLAVLIRREKGKFLDIFVQPGNFIAVEDIKRLISKSEPFLVEDKNLCPPDKLQKFWLPLLRKIHHNDLIQVFLEKLLLAQEHCSNRICQKTAVAWAQQILLGVTSKSLLAKCFQMKGVLFNLPCLVYACMKGSTPFSIELLFTIIAKFRNKEKYSNLFFLIALYQGHFLPKDELSTNSKKDPEQEIVFTVEDVEEELMELKAKKRGYEEKNIWSNAPATMDFSQIPLGAVLNPLNPDTDQDRSKPSSEESCAKRIKLGRSLEDDFIILDEYYEEAQEMTTQGENRFPIITPENFDMVYRRTNN